jgi:hypothetical protein
MTFDRCITLGTDGPLAYGNRAEVELMLGDDSAAAADIAQAQSVAATMSDSPAASGTPSARKNRLSVRPQDWNNQQFERNNAMNEIGLFDINFDTGDCYWSFELKRMLGVRHDAPRSFICSCSAYIPTTAAPSAGMRCSLFASIARGTHRSISVSSTTMTASLVAHGTASDRA